MKFEKDCVTGQLVKVYNSIFTAAVDGNDRADYHHTQEVEKLELDFGGIKGNRHYGVSRIADSRTNFMYAKERVEIRNNGQWSALAMDEVTKINKNLKLDEHELQPQYIGCNLLITGIKNFTSTPRGYYLVFTNTPEYRNRDPEQVVLINHGSVNPCRIAGTGVEVGTGKESLANKFPKAARDLRGLRGWVEKGGTLRPGMYLHILTPTGKT